MTHRPSTSAGSSRNVGLVMAAGFALIATMAVIPPAMEQQDAIIQMGLFAYGTLLYTAVGVVILVNRPGHRLGRLCLGIGLAFSAYCAVALMAAVWPMAT